ncbi:MAG: twin-arginine translocase TatA/TatE family subunit [Candidatus Dadabacteria bacterium]|nr:twin-arginine translocase TatA/TatE family subunit [Candidatus Dadabacteria bacterium]MCY4262887.1 twin-arginine translocase TatA/TatE family subunit [Candidatus Dadabacteria bacterium]
MFGLGTAELLIIMAIALLVLGPQELPKVARTLGRGIRELQRAKDDLKKNIEFEDDGEEKTKS